MLKKIHWKFAWATVLAFAFVNTVTVVTLLVGTADDKPLFKDVRSAQALKEALERVASVPSDYLMTFE